MVQSGEICLGYLIGMATLKKFGGESSRREGGRNICGEALGMYKGQQGSESPWTKVSPPLATWAEIYAVFRPFGEAVQKLNFC